MPDEDKSALSEPGFIGLSRISICNKGSSEDDYESKSAPKQTEKSETRTISKARSQPRVVSKNEEKKNKKKQQKKNVTPAKDLSWRNFKNIGKNEKYVKKAPKEQYEGGSENIKNLIKDCQDPFEHDENVTKIPLQPQIDIEVQEMKKT